MDESVKNLIDKESYKLVSEFWNNFYNNTSGRRSMLEKWYKQYRGIPEKEHYKDGWANVVINETLQATETVVANEFNALFSEPRYVYCSPREQTDETNTKMVENLFLFYNDIASIKSKMLRSLRQRSKYGTCFAKVCWTYDKAIKNYRNKDGVINLGEQILKDHYDLQYIDELDIAIEPDKPDIELMSLVVIRKRVDRDYLQKMAKNMVYSPDAVKRVLSSSGGGSQDDGLNTKDKRLNSIGVQTQTKLKNKYEVLEAWGKVPRYWVDEDVDVNSDEAEELVQVVIEVNTDTKEVLRRERNPYWHGEIPVLMCQYILVDDEAYGIGICEMSERLQSELNAKRNQLLDHATEQIFPPMLINKAAGVNDEKFLIKPRQKIYTNISPQSTAQPLPLGGNPLENVAMDGIIKQDIRSITAATNPMQGIPAQKESTAFEINTLVTKGNARINVGIQDFADRFVRRMYKRFYSMLQQNIQTDIAVRILGEQGIKWEKVSAENLIYELDVIPKVATDFDSRTIIRNQLIQFAMGLAPLYPQINLYRIVKKVYELFGFDDADEVVPMPNSEIDKNMYSIEEEVAVLSMGQKIDVKYYEDHLTKVSQLFSFVQQNGQNMTPQAKDAFQDAISQHMQYLQKLEQMTMQMGGQVSPQGQVSGVKPVRQGTKKKIQNSGQQTAVGVNSQSQRDTMRKSVTGA